MSDLSLKKLNSFSGRKGPQIIVIMDGVGMGRDDQGNAVKRAHTPTLNRLFSSCPWTTLQAHGTAVGLPSDADMGNSEVGHNAIGAGRVFAQGAKLVNEAIASGKIFEGSTWKKIMQVCLGEEGTLHICGMLSDGNVHSHQNHLFALIRRADQEGVKKLRIHLLLDGRDVSPTSALEYVEPFEAFLLEMRNKQNRDYQVASGGGRNSVTMDRYWANPQAVERGWNAHVHGEGRKFHSATEAILAYRAENPEIQDQNMMEFVIVDDSDKPIGQVKDGDAFVFFNFRGDRALPLTMAFENEEFPYFKRGRIPKVTYVGMMQYDGDLELPKLFLVTPPTIERTMGEYLAANGCAQFACSESYKYGHVTYFWNGNRNEKFNEKLETYQEVKSELYILDERPWMQAAEITDKSVEAVLSGKYRQLRINLTNGDMVGHTGNIDAAILAVSVVDLCLARILKAIDKVGGIAIVTADHGNADEMYEFNKKEGKFKVDAQGKPRPLVSHTLNPVPFIIYDPGYKSEYKICSNTKNGLGNIAATALNLLGYEAPEDYMKSLIEF